MNHYASFVFVATSLVTGVCCAQSMPASDVKAARANVPVVTVIAPPNPKIIEKQAYDFVRSYAATPNPGLDQIGRWHDPVCVMVLGLPLADQAARIKARIETMAQSLGLPAASATCKPNVEIAFEDDPQGAMNGVSRSQQVQYLLGYYHLSRTKQLRTVTHPIQAWYVTSTITDGVNTAALLASGTSAGLVSGVLSSSLLGEEGAVDDPEITPPPGCYNRFTACSKSAFYNVLIVADNKALRGNKLSTVADDLVMLALTEPKSLDGCNVLPSVIDRYAIAPCAGRTPPDELTPADKAYLSALYAADLEGRKHQEQTDIASRMATLLINTRANAETSPGSTAPPPAAAKAP